MVNRCNAAGVKVIADLVINHMSGRGSSGSGTGGSGYNGDSQDYPGVPFSNLDFHQPYCEIQNYGNADEVRNCYLVALNDLDGGKDYVRGKIADYINDLVNIGVMGFRVDASKHMWPGDLEGIQVWFFVGSTVKFFGLTMTFPLLAELFSSVFLKGKFLKMPEKKTCFLAGKEVAGGVHALHACALTQQ